jgi:hypothetical protein
MTKTYNEKPVDKWTVNDLLSYTAERHAQVYGVEYRPYRSWSAERGLIGGLIGTRQKPRKYEPELVKQFIDVCFKEYRPSKEYPGVSFTFLWTYKSNVWQKILLSSERKKYEIQSAIDQPELEDWL